MMIYESNKMRRDRAGLVLLIVLGMLAMFSLLAVTYVVTASSSIAGSQAIKRRAQNSGLDLEQMGAADKVVRQLIRGTNDQNSIFYATGNLLGDIYGPDPIRTTAANYFGPDAVIHYAVPAAGDPSSSPPAPADPERNVNLVKLSLNRNAEFNGPLSDMENEYNSRLLTFTEGPLTGQTFRVLKYVGKADRTTPDPNTFTMPELPWRPNLGTSADAVSIQYSVLLDLNEVASMRVTGEVLASDGTIRSVSRSVNDWITEFGVATLFYAKTTLAPASATNMVGYKLIINDAAYNYPGIGIEDIAVVPNSMNQPTAVPGFGNIDARRLLRTSRPISPAILPHYDYLKDNSVMATNAFNSQIGVEGIGSRRTDHREFRLYGASNEGSDTPDFRDMFLAHQTAFNGVPSITPSFHRPAVINHISHVFGNPSALTAGDVAELLRLLDASTGRIMSVQFGSMITNSRFAPHATFPRLNLTTWSTPPTPAEISALRAYVLSQINGPWDVDNDGDGIPDSVWVDPGLGIVYSPDGRRLRPLVSLLVEDLDSRINLNVAGDRSHTLPNFDVAAFPGTKRTGTLLSQGMGTGPADISLRSIFTKDERVDGTAFGLPVQMVGSTQSGINTFSFFDELYGARRYKGAKHPSINYLDGTLDRVPGKHGPLFANDPISQVNEREQHLPFSNARMPGLPLSRRGSVGMTFDVFGNPVMANPSPLDGNPYSYSNPSQLSETMDDPYDRNAMTATSSDDPLGLEDLEVILRRYDADVQAYPSRIREMFNKFNLQAANSYGNLSAINREVTTRSAELRHPTMAAAFKTTKNFGAGDVVAIESGAPSYIHFIQMLHSQRYRSVAYPPSAADDPGLTYAAIAELFPVEFSRGLKMDLNRPFGNGFDDNGNGDIDEPIELTNFENELHPVATTTAPFVGSVATRASFPSNTSDPSVGRNNPENEQSSYGKDVAQVVRTSGVTGFRPTALRGALAGRQMLARNLYCLAQLIIPKDFVFDGMNVGTMTQFQLATIRARAIAQWAVNVVDYRDADSVMTRFEYDILPFGAGTGIGAPAAARPAYWAPDHVAESVNGISNRAYVGVVWGMEIPEILLTETMAYHDKKLKDTNMDNSSRPQSQKINDPAAENPDFDDSLDQYRFPDAGLLIELFVNRSTGPINDPTFAGTPSLYSIVGGERRLNLSRMAPASAAWGRQPVWRIAISDVYGTAQAAEHPQTRMAAGTAASLTHQQSIEPAVTGQTDPARTGESNLNQTSFLEQHLGNGLHYDIGGSPTMARGFDRFVWFTNQRPTAGQLIPDLLPANATAADRCVYVSQSPSVEIPGGSYLVVGPKYRIPFGSLTHNQFRGTLYPSRVLQADMADAALRPIYSPSMQRISLEAGTVTTRLLNDTPANDPWLANIRPPFSVICTAEAPSAAWRDNGSGRPRIFRDGVGLNISYPNPITTNPYWSAANLPTRRLNSADTAGSRRDDTPGFGDEDVVLPDSWVDLSNIGTDRFPDVPIDRSNTVLTANNMYPSGTYQNVRAAYLQRLADPDVPYDPTFNPYITVDWMSIDLTVFNGESSREMDDRDAFNQMHVANATMTSRPIFLASRYKTGELMNPPGGETGISYLSPVTTFVPTGITNYAVQTTLPMLAPRPEVNPGTPAVPTNPESFLPLSLGHERLVSDWGRVGNTTATFGYLNAGNLVSTVNATNEPHSDEVSSAPNTTFDGFGRPIGNATNPYFAGAGEFMASPLWANRQFATPYEIMMVPYSSPGQFGMHYSVRTFGPEIRDQFKHLPKFQQMNQWFVDVPLPSPGALGSTADQWQNTAKYWGNPFNGPRANRQADWALLFDFVETAPLFADANSYWRPDVMSHLANRNTVAARFLNSFIPQGYYLPDGSDAQGYRGPSFLAPFNYKPSYVAAGKININTVAVSQRNPGAPIRSHALKALETLYYTGDDRNREYGAVSEDFARDFVENRRGYATPVSSNSFFGTVVNQELHPDYPTQFVGAYRSALSANLAPTLPDPVANARMRQRHGVETTLLRTRDLGGSAPTLSDTPMLLNRPGVADHVNVSQPYDYYQRAIRLPNLVSNQSNVFAVWMTIGLFEYDPLTGYGEEYVNESGGVQRERRFYIIDRSTPVGFKQGEDLNAKKTVLLERKIP